MRIKYFNIRKMGDFVKLFKHIVNTEIYVKGARKKEWTSNNFFVLWMQTNTTNVKLEKI